MLFILEIMTIIFFSGDIVILPHLNCLQQDDQDLIKVVMVIDNPSWIIIKI